MKRTVTKIQASGRSKVPMVGYHVMTNAVLAKALAELPPDVRSDDELALWWPKDDEPSLSRLRACICCGSPLRNEVRIEVVPGLLYPCVTPESNLAFGARPPFLDPGAAVILSRE